MKWINSVYLGRPGAKAFLAIICVIIASSPGILLAPLGLSPFDECYQVLNSMDYRNTPLAPLSNYLGCLFSQLFGWEMIKFRYLALFLHILSIAMGCLYLFSRNREYLSSLVCCCILTAIASIFRLSQNLYGWDSWTLPFLVLIIIQTINYVENPRIRKLFVLGILTAILGLCRVPNFVICIPICFALFVCEKYKKLANIYIYIGVTALSTLFLILLMYGSITCYVHALADNRFDTHSMRSMINPLIDTILSVGPLLLMMLGLLSVTKYLSSHIRKRIILCIITILLIAIVTYSLVLSYNDVSANVQKYWVAYTLLVALFSLYSGDKLSLYSFRSFKVLLVVILSCTTFAGSDTGILKFASLPIIPILFSTVQQSVNLRYIKIIGIIVAISMVAYSPISLYRTSFADEGISKATFIMGEGLCKGLKTNKERGEKITSIIHDFKPYANSCRTLILRNGTNYSYEYIFQSRNPYIRHFFSGNHYDDVNYVAKVKNQILQSDEPIALLYFPADTITLMQQVLDSMCRKDVKGDGYEIYTSNYKD